MSSVTTQARALVVLSALLLGCGPREGSLTLRLVPAPFEDPFQGVEQLRVRVLDRDFVVLRQLEQAPPGAGGRVELGELAPGEQRFEVQALGGGQVRARGWSRLLAPEAELALDERIPFATAKVAVALPVARALTGPFVADGVLDEWRASPSLVLDESARVSGPPVSALDLRAELRLAWSTEELLFAILVSDDCPSLRPGEPAGSCGAGQQPERVALGFDAGDDGGVVYGQGDLWIELRAQSVTVLRGELKREELPVAFALAPDGRGYVVEGALKSSALKLGLGPTSRLGLELVIGDQDPGQSEATVLRASGTAGDATAPTPPEAMGTLGLAPVSP